MEIFLLSYLLSCLLSTTSQLLMARTDGITSLHSLLTCHLWLSLVTATPSRDWLTQSQAQNYFTTGGLPPISSSWNWVPWGSWPKVFLQLNRCDHSPYVASSMTIRWVCLLRIGFAFVKCTYRTYSRLLKILPFAKYTSPLSVQALESRSYVYLTCLILQRQLNHLNGRKLHHRQV
jgi:hypothetical protein